MEAKMRVGEWGREIRGKGDYGRNINWVPVGDM
jgi:hypothetical protein